MAGQTRGLQFLGYRHREIDCNPISFDFGVILAVGGDGRAAEQMGGGVFTSVSLTDYRGSLENLDAFPTA